MLLAHPTAVMWGRVRLLLQGYRRQALWFAIALMLGSARRWGPQALVCRKGCRVGVRLRHLMPVPAARDGLGLLIVPVCAAQAALSSVWCLPPRAGGLR